MGLIGKIDVLKGFLGKKYASRLKMGLIGKLMF